MIGYLQGGDTLKIILNNVFEGQTFRPIADFTVYWADVDLTIPGLVTLPALRIYHANADHEPIGDYLSHSSYWLFDLSFATRAWLFFEPWGKSLTENHPWQILDPAGALTLYFNQSKIFCYCEPTTVIYIYLPSIEGSYPLLSPSGSHLFFHHCSPITTINPQSGFISYSITCWKAGVSWVISPIINRGSNWGPWGTYESADNESYAFDYGFGPSIDDLTERFIRGRILAGLDPDPTGWLVDEPAIAIMQSTDLVDQYLQSNYIGLAHQAFSPAPPNDYPLHQIGYTHPFKVYRIRFRMTPTLLVKDNLYCLTIALYAPIPPEPAFWRYDKGDASFPSGIRISSADYGDTWEKHPDDDHIFYLFGSPPIPPPPPDPPAPNVAPIDCIHCRIADGEHVLITTSTPSHLWLFVTLHPPDKHKTPIYRRGISLKDDVRYCFVVFEPIEQIEPGDTLAHSFQVLPWPYCQTRYYTFRALISNEWSPSVGPIFTFHPVETTYKLIVYEHWTS